MGLIDRLVKLGKAVAVFGVELIVIDFRLRMIVRRIAAPFSRETYNLAENKI